MQQRFILQILLLAQHVSHAHHQELKSIIRWLLPVVFKLLVWCGAEGYGPVCRMLQQPPYNTLELLAMGIVVPETC